MRFAYADPPYVGQATRHYGPNAKEVNHTLLIAHLQDFDAWALSCSASSARMLWPLCSDDTRMAAWVKPFASFKPGVNPAYCWEPVLFRSGRKRSRDELTVRDWLSANITLERGVHGAKPDTFWFWLFALVGAEPCDEFVDLFPGSGGGVRCWDRYCGQARLAV
jgi:hypothetical protein